MINSIYRSLYNLKGKMEWRKPPAMLEKVIESSHHLDGKMHKSDFIFNYRC
jgi:hypothetical protein